MLHEGTFEYIISLENLLKAWYKFRAGKRSRKDVQEFEFHLEDNLFALHSELSEDRYHPGGYFQFRVTDPKPRLISKAFVCDRLLHQAIYQVLYPPFDQTFIFDSYSCRVEKGTHKAFQRLVDFSRQISANYTKPCWSLKMDVKKFFDSVDHQILKVRLAERISDHRLLNLLDQIIDSFAIKPNKSMPLGNLTSQLFANIYMDPLDKFVKHKLNVEYYLRYSDDVIILNDNPDKLLGYFVEISRFVRERLLMNLHPDKTILRKLYQGIDFVGYVVRPHYRVPRVKTVRRIIKRVKSADAEAIKKSLPSYLGYLDHARSYQIRKQIEELLQERN